MNTVDMAIELEELRAKVKRYESEVVPLANERLEQYRQEAVKQYRLNDEEKEIMIERLATETTPEAIKAKALQVAGALKAEDKYGDGADPSTKGNGARRLPRQSTPEDIGKQAYNKAIENSSTPTAQRIKSQRAKNDGVDPANNGRSMGNIRSGFVGQSLPAPPKSEKQVRANVITRFKQFLKGANR